MPLAQTLSGLLPVIGTGVGAYLGGPMAPIGASMGSGIGTVAQNLVSDYFRTPSTSEQARNQLLQQLQGPAPFQRIDFTPIANEEMRRFERNVLPSIANQFGGLDALNSSGYRQALTGAGQDLQTRLAALRSQHELNQQSAMMGSEERRRQMLANLAGGTINQDMNQDFARQSQMNNLVSALPGQMMDLARFRADVGQRGLGTVLQQLVNQQNAQNTAIDQTGRVSLQALTQNFENLIRQDPQRYEQILRPVLDIINSVTQVGGTALRGAVGGI